MKKIATIVVLAVALVMFSYNAFACDEPSCNCSCGQSECSSTGCTECLFGDADGCCSCCASGESCYTSSSWCTIEGFPVDAFCYCY